MLDRVQAALAAMPSLHIIRDRASAGLFTRGMPHGLSTHEQDLAWTGVIDLVQDGNAIVTQDMAQRPEIHVEDEDLDKLLAILEDLKTFINDQDRLNDASKAMTQAIWGPGHPGVTRWPDMPANRWPDAFGAQPALKPRAVELTWSDTALATLDDSTMKVTLKTANPDVAEILVEKVAEIRATYLAWKAEQDAEIAARKARKLEMAESGILALAVKAEAAA